MHWDALLDLALKLLAVLLLVALNGFFVAAEFALVKVRDTQLAVWVNRGHRRARVATLILKRLDTFLSAAQLGITLASLGLGWIGEPVFTALLLPVFGWLRLESLELRHVFSFAIGFSVLTFLHISAGEQAPKWLAIRKPLPTALAIAYPMLWFHHLAYPFVVALNGFSQWLLRQVGIEPMGETERPHSEEELRLLFTTSQRAAGASKFGRDLVLNALDLRRRIARDVMRPRHEIVAFNTESGLAECLDLAEKTRYSRFPLCVGGDVDRTLGVVHIKDLYALRAKARSAADLASAARKLIYVPETARLEKLLQMLLERRLHVAVVVDEYGGTTGMVTLENVLEELVGQIQDEFDTEKPLLVRTSETTWELAGALPIHELAELVEQPLQEEGIVTVSGLVTHRLGGFPKVGDTLALGHYQLRVEVMDRMRVAQLQLTRRDAVEN